MVLLSWKNFPIPQEKSRMLSGNQIVFETKESLNKTDPTDFNYSRALELLPQFLNYLDNLWKPVQLIIYDFFCVEAHVVAKMTRTRSVCCIPAIPFAFPSLSQNEILAKFTKRYSNYVSPVSAVSDFQMMNDQSETKWLVCPPALQLDVSYFGKTCYVDVLPPNHRSTPPNSHLSTDIYVCFGTVVTGNLFENADDKFKNLLLRLYETVCDFVQINDFRAIISIPGEKAFDFFTKSLRKTYERRVYFTSFIDQSEILRGCKGFVTHGGGNSITEAIDACVPMLCIPFFGDQWASAQCIKHNNFGVAYTENVDLVTTKQCLKDNNTFEKKIAFLHDNLTKLCFYRFEYQQSMFEAKKKYCAKKFDQALNEKLTESILCWKDGDLLFGSSIDRKDFCANWKLPSPDFQFGKIFRRTDQQQFPPLIDHYHDYCYGNDQIEKEAPQPFDENLLATYKASQPVELQGKTIASMTHEQVAQACIAGINFFITNFPRNIIHFIVGPDFMQNKRSIAHAEMTYIRQLQNAPVLFYCHNLNGDGTLVRVDVRQVFWFNWDSHFIDEMLLHQGQMLNCISKVLQTHLSELTAKFGGALMESRLKQRSSLMANFAKNKFLSTDVIGFRIVHPFTESLFAIAAELQKRMDVKSKTVSERGKVIHLIVHFNPVVFELQLWPSLLHSCFCAEHDTIYKPLQALTDNQIENSRLLREKEHKAQDLLDQFGPLIQN